MMTRMKLAPTSRITLTLSAILAQLPRHELQSLQDILYFATMTIAKGAIQSLSTKQKVNARSSTEAELVSFDDTVTKVVWTKLFMESQGLAIKENAVERDNESTMKLEVNGKSSSSKRTRHFNIKYFYVTDLIQRGEITTRYCPTDAMTSDYKTKPLLGEKFHRFRAEIMGWG